MTQVWLGVVRLTARLHAVCQSGIYQVNPAMTPEMWIWQPKSWENKNILTIFPLFIQKVVLKDRPLHTLYPPDSLNSLTVFFQPFYVDRSGFFLDLQWVSDLREARHSSLYLAGDGEPVHRQSGALRRWQLHLRGDEHGHQDSSSGSAHATGAPQWRWVTAMWCFFEFKKYTARKQIQDIYSIIH